MTEEGRKVTWIEYEALYNVLDILHDVDKFLIFSPLNFILVLIQFLMTLLIFFAFCAAADCCCCLLCFFISWCFWLLFAFHWLILIINFYSKWFLFFFVKRLSCPMWRLDVKVVMEINENVLIEYRN